MLLKILKYSKVQVQKKRQSAIFTLFEISFHYPFIRFLEIKWRKKKYNLSWSEVKQHVATPLPQILSLSAQGIN